MKCVEAGCDKDAGTPWTDYWCMEHDEIRRARITKSMDEIAKRFGLEDKP